MATETRLKLKLRYATVEPPALLDDLADVLLTAPQEGHILIYDFGSATWYNVSLSTAGAMLVSVYDPGGVGGDAFAMDNMVEGTLTKIMTAAERSKLAALDSALYLPKTLEINDQRGLGPYALLASDKGKMVLVDGAVTIPAGLGAGFQCAVVNSAVAAVAFTPDVAYTTVIGAPLASLSPDGLATVGVVAADTIIVKGETE